MPELRKDPVVGRWVIIAGERARRPGNFVDRSDNAPGHKKGACALCNNRRKNIPGSAPAGDVRVVRSRDSVPNPQAGFQRSQHGLYDVIDGFGAHEVVIEAPEHIVNMADLSTGQIRDIFKTYASRIRELEKDKRFQYVLVYKNYRPTAGSRSIGHTRSHIVATPVRPLRVKEKLIGAKMYFDTYKKCVYCDLIRQETGTKERIVHETQHFIAVIPFAARFLFETWVLPKTHHCDFQDGIHGKEEDLAGMMNVLLKKLQQGLDDPAYNFVIQTAPFRGRSTDAHTWETITRDYHWHLELLPRLTRVAGFEKGTGFYICTIPPEDMAEYLREI